MPEITPREARRRSRAPRGAPKPRCPGPSSRRYWAHRCIRWGLLCGIALGAETVSRLAGADEPQAARPPRSSTSGLAPAEPHPAGVAPSTDPAESSEQFFATARAGLSELEGGRAAAALELLERALGYPSTRLDRAALLFNMGVCLIALQRFDDAEERLLASAGLDPTITAPARIQAGFAALGAGRLSAARRHLTAARAGATEPRDSEVLGGINELEDAIAKRSDALAVEKRLARCAILAEAGAAELGRKEYHRAQRTLEHALVLSADMPPLARAELHYGAAVAAYHASDLNAARAHVDAATALNTGSPELRLLRSRILLRQGERRAARLEARKAADRGAKPSELDQLNAELDAGSPLPKRGWSGELTALGGWDSNPAQSGLASEGGPTSGSAAAGSAMVEAFGGLALTGRYGERSALRLEYSVDWLGLLATSVSDLSTQAHGMGVKWYRELGDRWLLRLGAGGIVRLVRFETPEVTSYGPNLGATLIFAPSSTISTQVDLRVAGTVGVDEYSYLGGTRVDARLAERWTIGRLEFDVGAGARYAGLGTVVFDNSSELSPGCRGRRCETLTVYTAPLAYAGPRVDAALSAVDLGPLAVRLESEGEYRAHLEPATVSSDPGFRKVRRDWRWRVGAEAELGLDETDHLAILVQYAWLGCSSNVDYDASDPAHALDYGTYSFSQHLALAGVGGRF